MTLDDVCELSYWERVELKRGDDFTKYPLNVRVEIDEGNRQTIEAEMLDEIHVMLRHLCGLKEGSSNDR